MEEFGGASLLIDYRLFTIDYSGGVDSHPFDSFDPSTPLGTGFAQDKYAQGKKLRYDWNLAITNPPMKLLATTTTKAMVR